MTSRLDRLEAGESLTQGEFAALLREAGLINVLPLLLAAHEGEQQLPQGLLRLVKGDVGRTELLLPGEGEAHLPHLGDQGDIPGDVQLPVGFHRGHLVPLRQYLQQIELRLEHQVGKARHGVIQGRNVRLQPRPDDGQALRGPHVAPVVIERLAPP